MIFTFKEGVKNMPIDTEKIYSYNTVSHSKSFVLSSSKNNNIETPDYPTYKFKFINIGISSHYKRHYIKRKIITNDKQTANIKRLDEISNFEYDWNGYGAKPFSGELIAKCKNIINCLDKQPSIYPTGRKSIQIQYEFEDKTYLEFEIFKAKINYLYVPERIYTNAIEKEIPDNDINKINEIVNKTYEKHSAKWWSFI